MRGSIRVRHGKRGTTYTATWRDGHGRQRGKTFYSQRAAEGFLSAELADAQADLSGLPRGLPGHQWLDAYVQDLQDRLARGSVKPSTVASYTSVIKVHLRPAFGRIRSDRLTHRTVADWLSTLAQQLRDEDLSPKTHNNILGVFGALVTWSRHPSRRHVVADLTAHLERAEAPKIERLFLEPVELRRLLDLAKEPLARLALHLAAYAGLRRGEVVALQAGDLDAERRQLAIRRAVSGGKVSTPKTTTSRRIVDLAQTTVELLQQHTQGRGADAWLFPRADGEGPMHPDTLDDLVVPVFRAMRTPARLHSLRHTYASILIAQGETLKYVSRQMGHSSIQITQDLYGHLFQATRDAAMSKLEATITAPAPPPLPSVDAPAARPTHLRLVT